jgi:hypothetical protein
MNTDQTDSRGSDKNPIRENPSDPCSSASYFFHACALFPRRGTQFVVLVAVAAMTEDEVAGQQ